MLDDTNKPRRGTQAAGGSAKIFLYRIAGQRFDCGIADVIAERFDLVDVKAFRDQLAFSPGDDLMEAVIAILDVARAALDDELFRRHTQHPCLREYSRGDVSHIV